MALIVTTAEVLQTAESLADDPDLHSLIAAAEARVLRYLGRSRVRTGATTHGFWGDGESRVWLPDQPIDPDAAISWSRDGVAVSGAALSALKVRGPRTLWNPAGWAAGEWHVVGYSVKQDQAPADLRRACSLLVLGLAASAGKFDAGSSGSGSATDSGTGGDVKRIKVRNEETEYFEGQRSRFVAAMSADAEHGLGPVVRSLLDPHRRLDF